jgi:hypothetical protein
MYYLDYSAGKPSAAVIKQHGYGGVIRYIDDIANKNYVRTKHTSKAEYDDHIRNGLKVLLVMEVTTGDADGGYARGQEYARRAKRGADYLGYNGVIFFCNDTPEVHNATSWANYLKGAASVLGWNRVGAYGFANAMDIANRDTDCKYFWEAGRWSDARARESWLNFWQDNNVQVTVGGINCDRNLVLKPMGTVGGEDVMNAAQEKKINDKLDYITRVDVENQRRINAANAALVKANAAIAGLVTLVANGSDLTVEDVQNAVEAALKDAVIDVDVNVNHPEAPTA